MISLNFNLRNPWSNRFENLWCRSYATPFENKFVELEVTRDFNLVSFRLNWTVHQSHAGLDLEIGVCGYNINFQFYDHRHWNSKKKTWEINEKGVL